MVDQRAQDGGGRAAAERADKGPVIRAGLALPAAIAGGDPRGVVEKMRGFCQHDDPSNLYRHSVPKPKFNCLAGLTIFSAIPEGSLRIIRDPNICQLARNSRQSNYTDVADQISEDAFDRSDLILPRQLSQNASMRMRGKSVEADRPITIGTGDQKFQLPIWADILTDRHVYLRPLYCVHARNITDVANSMTSEVMASRRLGFTASPRAGRLAPARLRAPARSRYLRHIPGWCGRRRTTASAPR